MIKIVAKSTVQEGKREEFLALVKELIEKSRAEEGNISYDLWEDIKNPNVLTFIEEWKDQEAISIHNSSEHFTRIVPQIGKLTVADGGEVRLYTQVL